MEKPKKKTFFKTGMEIREKKKFFKNRFKNRFLENRFMGNRFRKKSIGNRHRPMEEEKQSTSASADGRK